jgi:adenosylcobinamide-phosphate synthase
MSFLSVLFALLLEQARPMGQGNAVHAALRAWVRWCSRNFDAGQLVHGWLSWGFAVGLPSLVSLAIYWLLNAFIGWPAAVVWSVLVLYATLGFRQFSFHFTQIRDALTEGDEDRARQLLAQWRQMDASELPRSEILRQVIEHSVLAAHRHVFGVLVWFSVLAALGCGPAGAVLYRLSEFVARYWQHQSQSHHQPVSEALQVTADNAWAIMDWLPARVTAISFAVVGSFEEAIDGWRNFEPRNAADNDGIILAATAGSVNIELMGRPSNARASGVAASGFESGPAAAAASGQAPELAHLAVIVGLVWRTVVMWMVLLALLTLARLLG